MGPYPHDAPPAEISARNPAGTDGFEFVEFAHPEPGHLEALFVQMGYSEVARHKTKDISLYRQGGINYIVNREVGTHASRFVSAHGPCAPSMAWRVVDARHAVERAVSFGAKEYTGDGKSIDAPAIEGIGGSLLYFVDNYSEENSPYSAEFEWLGYVDAAPKGVGF
ncbi:MAG: 4-hydroxyphenylpyruvate dioxygenase, partial [Pseudomonadota bacterium]